MPGVRLILALHNHQPVGNFDGVFEASFRDSYLPFLEVMEDHPDLPFVLHTSGPLLEWLVERQPDYIRRLRRMVDSGRVEILGGGFFEPILPMIPHRDRVGQIRAYSDYLEDVFGVRPRGVWIAERVWEQHLVSALAEAGVEYTVLDDFHFLRAGVDEHELRGFFLTEEDGQLLKVFPIAEKLRYLIPFREPHDCYEYLRRVAEERPDSVVVFADDGEKFGVWPDTNQHVYGNGWLRRFCDMISGNRQWLEPTTFSQAVDTTLPRGKVYLPDSSYREMTEWVLPAHRQAAYQDAARWLSEASHQPGPGSLTPFVRAGGFWRNFKVRYPESDEMYARMLDLSARLDRLTRVEQADPDFLDVARQELFRGQCNCTYWHGAFGGLYLPHLRNAIYRHLIAAHNALDEAEGKTGPRVSIDVADFNLDARQEVRLENDRLVALVRPAQGGHVYELDVRGNAVNVLATLERRPEVYHAAIAAAVAGSDYDGGPSILKKVVLKQDGLDQLLVYDRQPRKALVDHVFGLETTLDDLGLCRDVERGDFATGTYTARIQRGGDQVALVMERPGLADGHPIQVRKTLTLRAGEPGLTVDYTLDGLPPHARFRFAVEINLAAMAGHADDRYYADPTGERLGMLDARVDQAETTGVSLTDEWLDLAVRLAWTRPGGLWCFPVATVSQSESGFEGVYQSSAVVPHWVVTADSRGRWDVQIRWTLDTPRTVGVASGAIPETTATASLTQGVSR